MREDLQNVETNLRSMAKCKIPDDECPWDRQEHTEAQQIVELIDYYKQRYKYMVHRAFANLSGGASCAFEKELVEEIERLGPWEDSDAVE